MVDTAQKDILTKIQDIYVPFLKLLIPFVEKNKIATEDNLNKLKAMYRIFTTSPPAEQTKTFLDNKMKLEAWYKKAEKKKRSCGINNNELSQEVSRNNNNSSDENEDPVGEAIENKISLKDQKERPSAKAKTYVVAQHNNNNSSENKAERTFGTIENEVPSKEQKRRTAPKSKINVPRLTDDDIVLKRAAQHSGLSLPQPKLTVSLEKLPEHVIQSYTTNESISNIEASMQDFQANDHDDLLSSDTCGESFNSDSKLCLMSTTSPTSSVVEIHCSNCSNMENRMTAIETELIAIKRLLMDVKNTANDVLMSVDNLKPQLIPQKLENFEQLDTHEALSAFNERLKDPEVFSKMVLFFSSFGGKDAHSSTRKIMSVLISNNLAQNYNWIGTTMKVSFQKYKDIIQLIAASVKHNQAYEDVPVNEIQRWMARWLRYATDRESNRGKRKFNDSDRLENCEFVLSDFSDL